MPVVYPFINNLRKEGIPIIKYKQININEILGSGSSGTAYKCIINNKLYCAKEFSSEKYYSIKSMFNDWLNYEIYISKILSNNKYSPKLAYISYKIRKHIVYVYIIYEYINNITLFNLINNRNSWKLDENKVPYFTIKNTLKYKLIINLIKAVQSLHNKNIIHGDIKPENILVEGPNIYLIDYGSSCIVDDNLDFVDVNEYETVLGTPGYIGPELYDHHLYYSSDIYSLGVCILEILIGDIWIYESDTLNYEYIQSNIDKETYDILMKCMDNNISKIASI